MSKEMGMSNSGKQGRRTALWAVATITLALALPTARANAQAPTDPQIVGIVSTADPD
jgi:predicted outer membrane protein